MSVVAFRPSNKTKEAIDLLLKQKKAKSKSDAVNQLIELAIESEGKTFPQLEHPEGEEGKTVLWRCSYIPQPSMPPFLRKELDRFFRGQDSEIIRLLLSNPDEV